MRFLILPTSTCFVPTVCHGCSPSVCVSQSFWMGSSHRRAVVMRLPLLSLWREAPVCRHNIPRTVRRYAASRQRNVHAIHRSGSLCTRRARCPAYLNQLESRAVGPRLTRVHGPPCLFEHVGLCFPREQAVHPSDAGLRDGAPRWCRNEPDNMCTDTQVRTLDRACRCQTSNATPRPGTHWRAMRQNSATDERRSLEAANLRLLRAQVLLLLRSPSR